MFVQFSDECIRDATGVWLKAYVFDGIQYILSFADPKKTENVVINVSYGPTTGPHDGTAGLELALTAFVTEFNGTPGKPKLEIVLPAGNAYLRDGHVAFTRQATQPDHVEWMWRLPPDNPCSASPRYGSTTPTPRLSRSRSHRRAGQSRHQAAAPSRRLPASPFHPIAGSMRRSYGGDHTVWLLAVEPTRDVAEHGDWKIKVSGIPATAEVHAYVARSEPNMGVRTGAKRSYFVDHVWEATRSSEAGCTYVDGEFDKAGSLISRYGTLNGIATAKDFQRARGRRLHSGRRTQIALCVGGSRTQRPPLTAPRSRLRPPLRRVRCPRRNTGRRQQERHRVLA